MADTEETFDFWLKRKLRQINTDESIYGPYIVGILDGDGEEQVEEKIGAIEELLSGIIVSFVEEIPLLTIKGHFPEVPLFKSSEKGNLVNR